MAPARAASAGQLPLDWEADPRPGLPWRIPPMLPGAGDAPFDDEGWFFEPWWPGDPAIVSAVDGTLRVATGHLVDPVAAFPELRDIPAQLAADGVAMSGTLLVLDADGRPDRELLRRRVASPGAAGPAGGVEGTGAFVASDLLHVGGASLAGWPFAQRRARLLEVLADGERCVVARGLRGEGRTLAEAAASMGIGFIAARRLSARWRSGPAEEDFLRLPVLRPPTAESRPLLVLLQRLPLEG